MSDLPQLPEIDHFGEPLELLIPIPIHDNGEKLVDVFEVCPDLRWMHESPRFDFARFGTARESVAKMLGHAQSLLPKGLRLQIVGAFRPFETQKAMYDIVHAETKKKNPHWDDEFVTKYVNVFSAPPIWDTPPPHTTGGAVDLGIIDEKGERLDFVSPFEMGWDSSTSSPPAASRTSRASGGTGATVNPAGRCAATTPPRCTALSPPTKSLSGHRQSNVKDNNDA
jgi:zinc D-Ala-D-Ala dipeptidase